jgi:predicted nucleic acid-binding Zn ribbon protein
VNNCVECGKPLSGFKKKFCSETCHGNNHVKYMAEYYKKNKAKRKSYRKIEIPIKDTRRSCDLMLSAIGFSGKDHVITTLKAKGCL